MKAVCTLKKTLGAVISCNVSHRNSIDAPTLVKVLAGKEAPTVWKSHIETFFNELPKESILGVMSENGLSMDDLSKVFHSIPPVFQGSNFKDIISGKK